MKRNVLHFSIRTDASMALEEMRILVEECFGSKFHEGQYQKVPALVTKFLGIKVGLSEWLSTDNRQVFRLQSNIDDARLVRVPAGEQVEFVKVDISNAIIDLLDACGAGKWRIPGVDEIRAERDHGNALLRRYRAHQHYSKLDSDTLP